ncbi:peptidoglycan-binding protein, partial [bacterium]|nr:peptidoglycan-binding protein [bacterium]
GIFGERTKAAVVKFQKLRKLVPDGIVGEITWPRLHANTHNLQIIDCIDVFDPDLLSMEAQDIKNVGGNPFIIGGMSNGVEQAVMDIVKVVSMGSVFLLRFHGHGSPGSAAISEGKYVIPGEHLSGIHTGNISRLRPIIRRLMPVFGPYGCVQFMHCQTGRGNNGRNLLSTIAHELGVPVTAAILNQYGGGLTTFRFEGPTYTAITGGRSIERWCGGLPNFAPMSVP